MPPSFNATYFTDHILQLTNQNKHLGLARVRLTIFRGEGSLSDEVNHTPHFIIQSWAGKPESNSYNPDGLTADFYLDFKKNGDHFSGIKSNNYLGYAMAAFHARNKNLDDCVISNCYGRLVESTIANVFIVTNGVIKTPALTEGCIAGVMRRHLLNCCIKENLPFKEAAIPTDEVTEASEVFLTNALYGIRWVKKIGNSNYTNDMSALLHQKFIVPLFNV
jgi:branched-chain amino acid aminotransferase